jgi:hypothetical protein
MLLESGEAITWERHGISYSGHVSYLQSDSHSLTGESYVVECKTGEVVKEYTVYPSEVSFDKMLSIRDQKKTSRLNTLMRSEDMDD